MGDAVRCEVTIYGGGNYILGADRDQKGIPKSTVYRIFEGSYKTLLKGTCLAHITSTADVRIYDMRSTR